MTVTAPPHPLAGIPNPFRNTVVADAWQANLGDVPEIHGEAFRLCADALEAVRREGQTRSVVLYGEAGSGKTHLLRRFRAHCVGEPPHPVDPIRPEVVFVAAKLQTSPRHLWRYLRQSLVEDLLRPSPDGTSQLERVLLRRLAEVRPADADLRLWFEWLREAYPDPDDFQATVDGLLDRVDRQARMGRDLTTVLGHLLLGRHRRDATAWLRGDPLPEPALTALGLAPPADDAGPEDQAREVVGALCRLAGPRVPVVSCFDQVEALQVDRQDTAALFAFGRVVMELFHQAENVLILAAVQISFLEPLKEAMLRPAWDRLAMARKAIDPLLWPEAVRLVASRLDAVPALKALREQHPGRPVWPLDEARLRLRVGHGETARRILAECADQFDALQSGRQDGPDSAPPPPSPEAFLDAAWRDRLERARAANAPERSDDILSHGLPLLVRVAAPGWEYVAPPGLRDVDLLWRGPDGRVGVHLSNARDLRSVWRPLQRLPELLQAKKLEKLVVVRDARLGLDTGHVRALHASLLRQGVHDLRPSAEALSALDALRGLLSDARSGDLSAGGLVVDAPAVEAWFSTRMPPALRALADDLLAYPGVGPSRAAEDDLFDRLVTALGRRTLLPVAEVAAELGVSEDLITDYARRRPDGFGLLEGPPPVLFLRTGEAEPEGT